MKYLLCTLGFIFLVPTTFAFAGSNSYRVNHGSSVTVYSADDSVCRVVTNTHATNDYFIPTKTVVELNAFLAHLPSGVSASSCGCAASGACGASANGATCNTYSTGSVTGPATCPAVTTSTCSGGSWSPAPYGNATCTVSHPSCAASGGCGVTAHGGSCTSYSSSAPSGAACSTVSRTSTCSDGSWSIAPYAYSSCSSGCSGSGACGAASNGGTCNTYSSGSVTGPATCPSATTSTCNNGTWSPAPYSNASCTVIHPQCAASGGCGVTAHGGSCTTYGSTAPIGMSCAAASRLSTCSDGSWSTTPYAFSSCTGNGCLASGGCTAASHGGTCTSYSASSASCPTTCPAGVSSTCSNGSWSTTPAAYSSCTQNSGQACSYTSSANNCGATNTNSGTYNASCVCSASVPSAPANCSYTSQTYWCSGSNIMYNQGCYNNQCSATTLATPCVPAGNYCGSGSYAGKLMRSDGCVAGGTYGVQCSENNLVDNCTGTYCSGSSLYTKNGCSNGACTSSLTQNCSYGCSNGACTLPTTVFGPRLDGASSYVCQGSSSSLSTVQMPAGKTMVSCSYDYEAPYNNFNGGGPGSSWDAGTRTCSAWFNCYGGSTGGACGPYLGWCNQFNMRARLSYY